MKSLHFFKPLLLVVSIVLVTPTYAQTQTPPKAILSIADIDRFINTMDPIQTDLEKLGLEYNAEDKAVMEALKTNAEVQAVFNKHGWSNDFYPKIQAIAVSYAFLKAKVEMDKLPADQQQMMGPVIASLKEQYKSLVHDDDIATVQKKFQQLDQYFENK